MAGWNNNLGGKAIVWAKGDSPDLYSEILSHELAEIKTDFGGGGVKVTPGGQAQDQIGDNEGNNYAYRLNNGILVQPYWSANEGGWSVHDGVPQQFWLKQTNAAPNVNPQFTVTVEGDFAGNDQISIDQGSAGGVKVVINGQEVDLTPQTVRNVSFNSSTGSLQSASGTITAVNVITSGAPNSISIRGVPASVTGGVTIYSNAADSITIGGGGWNMVAAPVSVNANAAANVTIGTGVLSEITAPVNVQSTSWAGKPNVTVNDSSNWASTQVAIRSGGVDFTGAPKITYSGLGNLTVLGGRGTDTFLVASTPTNSRLNVVTGSGQNAVFIGESPGMLVGNGSLANIGGPVNVTSNVSGKTSITVDDSGDKTDRTATITSGSVQFSGLPVVTYMTPGVTGLRVLGGSANNAFFVNSTAANAPVTVSTGIGQNKVYVGNGSLANIAAPVNVQHSNSSGQTSLIVDDFKETGHNATVTSSSVSFTGLPLLAPGFPVVTFSGLSSLTVVGASGTNIINVTSVPPNIPVNIYNTQHNFLIGATSSVTPQWFIPPWDLYINLFN